VVYIGFVALVQTDMKKLVAYSSIAHMGFVTLGFFIFNQIGVEGAIVQMMSHGFISGAMFLCIGVMYDRMHSRNIADYGGVVNTMPKLRRLHDAVRDGQLRPAGHQRLRRRVLRDPRRGQVQLLDRHAGRGHHADPGRRLFAVDVQAGDLRRGGQRARAELTDIGAREFLMLACSRWRCCGWAVSEAVHRPDARLGGRSAAARGQSKIPRQAHSRGADDHGQAEPLRRRPRDLAAGGACSMLVVDLFISDARRNVTYALSLAALVMVAAICWCSSITTLVQYAFGGMYVTDPMANVLKLFATLGVGLMLVYAQGYARDRGIWQGEFFTLTLFVLLGVMVMISANNLLVVYLGLELQALSLYALVALRRDDARATEAAMKYFVLGALASGFLLYGMSMLYGATGTLDINEWRATSPAGAR
jgi:hypothetical protein